MQTISHYGMRFLDNFSSHRHCRLALPPFMVRFQLRNTIHIQFFIRTL
jgi:hypothetical protein